MLRVIEICALPKLALLPCLPLLPELVLLDKAVFFSFRTVVLHLAFVKTTKTKRNIYTLRGKNVHLTKL